MSSRAALDALHWYLETNPGLKEAERVLFARAEQHPILSQFDPSQIEIEQSFYPLARPLLHGKLPFSIDPQGPFDLILFCGSRNKAENSFRLRELLALVRPPGLLLFALENSLGGKSGGKLLSDLSLKYNKESKSRSQIYVAAVDEPLKNTAELIQWEGFSPPFFSDPALFSAEEADPGSLLLLEALPKSISGHAADFGSGNGFLARSVLERHKEALESLALFEAERRGLEVSRMNCDPLADGIPLTYSWCDLSQPEAPPSRFNWILMNPPYHHGHEHRRSLAQSFVRSAHRSLAPGGKLVMVGSGGIQYAPILESLFARSELRAERDQYQVFLAEKEGGVRNN